MIAGVLALVIGSSLRFVLPEYPESMKPSIRLWALGTLLLPTAWMLYVMRGEIPDALSIVVANGLLALAFAKQVEAVRSFANLSRNRPLIYLPVVAVIACEVLFTYAWPSARFRAVTVSAIISMQLWSAFAALMRTSAPRRRSHLLSAAAFATLASVLAVRAVHELVQEQGLASAMASSGMQTVAFGVGAAFPIAATLGFLLMCNDRLYLALVHNKERLRAITDNLPTIVAHIDPRERFSFANAYLARLLGMPTEAIVGHTLREVLGPRAHDEVRQHIAVALGGTAVTFEMTRDDAGQRRHYEASYVPDVDTRGNAKGFYVLMFDISRLKRAERELEHLAHQDGLTGLANRSKFDAALQLALGRADRSRRKLGVLYIDIDQFKKINDTHGHLVGDAVLREFASRLLQSLRQTDVVARLGGDEFAVLVEDLVSSDALERRVRKLLDALQSDFCVEGIALKISASIGIGIAETKVDAKALLAAADDALYEAKAAGRGTYRVATV